MNYRDKRKDNQEIAKERMQILREMKKKFPDFADRYDNLINKLSKKYKVPKDF